MCFNWIKTMLELIHIMLKLVLAWSCPRTLINTPPSNIGCESTDVMTRPIFWNVKAWKCKSTELAKTTVRMNILVSNDLSWLKVDDGLPAVGLKG